MTTLRPAQQTAVDWLRTRRRGCVVAPAGSGKTIIAAGALHAVVTAKSRNQFPRIGWMANTTEQCDQARAALRGFFDPSEVALIKVACAAAATDWSDRDVLVCDECHHFSAPGWAAQVQICRGTVWGFTATPDTGDEERDRIFYEFWQGNVHTIERAEVAHTLSSATVHFLDATDDWVGEKIDADITKTMAWRRRYWKGPEQALWGQVAWLCTVKHGIVENEHRNAAAVAVAARHSEPTLILVNQVEHALWFEQQLPRAAACYAAMGAKKRKQVMADFHAGKIQRIIATSLADEGWDAPTAAVLVLVSAGKSETKVVQRTGRVLRRHEGKAGATIYDFVDTFHNLAAKHSRRRREIYESLNYTIAGETKRLC
jgi:superfamily II DNA or RNA helicase